MKTITTLFILTGVTWVLAVVAQCQGQNVGFQPQPHSNAHRNGGGDQDRGPGEVVSEASAMEGCSSQDCLETPPKGFIPDLLHGFVEDPSPQDLEAKFLGSTGDPSKDLPGDSSKDLPGDSSKDLPGDFSEDFPGDFSEDLPGNSSMDLPGASTMTAAEDKVFVGKSADLAIYSSEVTFLSNILGISDMWAAPVSLLLFCWPFLLGLVYLSLIILYPDTRSSSTFERRVARIIKGITYTAIKTEDAIFDYLEHVTALEDQNGNRAPPAYYTTSYGPDATRFHYSGVSQPYGDYSHYG